MPSSSEPVLILNGMDDLSLYTTFCNPNPAIHKWDVTLEATLESDNKGYTSNQTNKKTTASKVPKNFSEIVNHLHLCASFRQIVEEVERCIYTFRMDKWYKKTSEDALTHAFRSI